jgi:hypothetical protein
MHEQVAKAIEVCATAFIEFSACRDDSVVDSEADGSIAGEAEGVKKKCYNL